MRGAGLDCFRGDFSLQGPGRAPQDGTAHCIRAHESKSGRGAGTGPDLPSGSRPSSAQLRVAALELLDARRHFFFYISGFDWRGTPRAAVCLELADERRRSTGCEPFPPRLPTRVCNTPAFAAGGMVQRCNTPAFASDQSSEHDKTRAPRLLSFAFSPRTRTPFIPSVICTWNRLKPTTKRRAVVVDIGAAPSPGFRVPRKTDLDTFA